MRFEAHFSEHLASLTHPREEPSFSAVIRPLVGNRVPTKGYRPSCLGFRSLGAQSLVRETVLWSILTIWFLPYFWCSSSCTISSAEWSGMFVTKCFGSVEGHFPRPGLHCSPLDKTCTVQLAVFPKVGLRSSRQTNVTYSSLEAPYNTFNECSQRAGPSSRPQPLCPFEWACYSSSARHPSS